MIRQDEVNISSGRSKRFVGMKLLYITKKDPEHWNTRGLTTKLRSKIGVLASIFELFFGFYVQKNR